MTLLFSGRISANTDADKGFQICSSSSDLVYSIADCYGNVRLFSLSDAFEALRSLTTITIVTDEDILTNVTLVSKSIVERTRPFQKKLLFLCLFLEGSTTDRLKLRSGTSYQIYAPAALAPSPPVVTSGDDAGTCTNPNCKCSKPCLCGAACACK